MAMAVVSIDVEKVDPSSGWWSVGIAVASSTGILLETFEVGCQRSVTGSTNSGFWNDHKAAVEYNTKLAAGNTQKVAEKHLLEFFDSISSKYGSDFMLLSDNPVFDIGVLDEILVRNGRKESCHRNGGMYRRPMCVWSYAHNRPRRRRTMVNSDMLMWASSHRDCVKHTALYDAVMCMEMYFSCA